MLNKVSIFILTIFSFTSCTKKNCIDIEKSNLYMKETKEWKFNDSIGNRQIIDDNNISQTLIFMGSDSIEYKETVWDDCGQSYGSFSCSAQFNTSLSMFNFMINLNAGSYIKEEYDKWPTYSINFLITSFINNDQHNKNIKFDLVNSKIIEGEGKVKYLDNYKVDGKEYEEVLKIDYDWMYADNDIKTLYYAKHYGIIQFINGFGNKFSVIHTP